MNVQRRQRLLAPAAPRRRGFTLECTNCGYDHDEAIAPDKCPRCGRSAFQIVPLPGTSLATTDKPKTILESD